MNRLPISLAALGLFAAAASAHGPAGADIKLSFDAPIPNIPGKSLRTVTVAYPPGGTTPAHRHAPSAYIYAIVLDGEIRSGVAGQPARVYKVGESWTENPGDHHVVSENASKTRPAKLLAVFVVDSKDTELTTLDPVPGAQR